MRADNKMRMEQPGFPDWGRLGLSKVIYEEARTRASDHSSWSLLAEGEGKEQYVYQLPNPLPDQIIASLIRNTIAFDYRNNSEVQRFVNSDMTPKEMRPMAGVTYPLALSTRQKGSSSVSRGDKKG